MDPLKASTKPLVKIEFDLPECVKKEYPAIFGDGKVVFKESKYGDEIEVRKTMPSGGMGTEMQVQAGMMRRCLLSVGGKSLSVADGSIDAFLDNLPTGVSTIVMAMFQEVYTPFDLQSVITCLASKKVVVE